MRRFRLRRATAAMTVARSGGADDSPSCHGQTPNANSLCRTMNAREHLRAGQVIPAHPLALTAARALDEPRQRGLTRYYIDAGAGGLAVGVHTTQFAIRSPAVALYRPVLELAMDEVRTALSSTSSRPFAMIAGVCG